MILQYKGFNSNWCYTEADTIIWANVWVGIETRDYRKGGARYESHHKELDKLRGLDDEQSRKDSLNLKYVCELHKAVDKLIEEETHCRDEIVYLIDGKFDDMENVCVVTLERPNNSITYVFGGEDKVAYILNNSGKTVQRIA